MGSDLQPLGRALMLLGILLAVCGLVILFTPKIPWLGRLPGDLVIRREHATFYFPLTTCLVVSILLSALVWLSGRFRP